MKIALLEIGNSHDETLYCQINFLRDAGHEVILIVSDTVKKRLLQHRASTEVVVPFSSKSFNNVVNTIRIDRYVKKNKIKHVVFNTASGVLVRTLCILLPKGVNCYGIAHNLRRLRSSSSQRRISKKVKHYWVLNDYLLDQLPSLPPRTSVSSLYPLHYPGAVEGQNSSKLTIGIVGLIEEKRRSYSDLISTLEALPQGLDLEIILLGNSSTGEGEQLKAEVDSKGISVYLKTFDEFVPHPTMMTELSKCHFLMPLVHPSTEYLNNYLTEQISGVFNLAFGLKIPMLTHEILGGIDDVKSHSRMYSDDLMELLSDPPRLIQESEKLKSGLNTEYKFTDDFQAQNYLRPFEA